MAHFAKLNENNIVEDVIVISNQHCNNLDFPQSEVLGQLFIVTILGLEGKWYQTSYNSNFRKNFAGIGCTYDVNRNAFIAPKPFNSWILNEETCAWEPPTPYPDMNDFYIWNEDIVNWEEIILEEPVDPSPYPPVV